MRQSNISNKMQPLTSETKVRFNVAMHGKIKGQEVVYGKATNQDQVNIRRRLADGDDSIEIVKAGKAKTQPTETQPEKPADGKAASTKTRS